MREREPGAVICHAWLDIVNRRGGSTQEIGDERLLIFCERHDDGCGRPSCPGRITMRTSKVLTNSATSSMQSFGICSDTRRADVDGAMA